MIQAHALTHMPRTISQWVFCVLPVGLGRPSGCSALGKACLKVEEEAFWCRPQGSFPALGMDACPRKDYMQQDRKEPVFVVDFLSELSCFLNHVAALFAV